jgi:cell division transport system ATP-binding protein
MIQFKNVTKKFGKEVVALEDVSFSIDKGDFVYLVGPTGSGKTTVFRLIIRDLLADEGEVYIGDMDVSKLSGNKIPKLRRTVGTIFQDLKLLMDHTVMENVILPLQFTGINEKEATSRAQEIIMQVGLDGKKDKFPLQLSGGERQRVAIARALIFNPEVLLADEPTGNLDSETSYQIIDLLQSINKLGTTILMTTHNKEIIENAKERVITVNKGKIAHDKASVHKKAEHKKEDAQKDDAYHESDSEKKEEEKADETS